MTSEAVHAWLSAALDSWSHQLRSRPPVEWIVYAAPLMVFFEIPRYYLTQLGVVVLQLFGRPRTDGGGERALLRAAPRISVVVAGRNEGATIGAAIESLLDQDYPDFEIIVVDDSSDDETHAVARRYARRGLIRLVRNEAPRGRAGKPSALNLGLCLANGEFIVSLDADTTFDRRLLQGLLVPFADPAVGVVAGNVLVRNQRESLLTRIQALEYAVGIDIHKRWTDLFRCTLQASGAITALRRAALADVGGWDQELAEDSDISLRMRKAGWQLAFAPEAVGATEVPASPARLLRQRIRWDRGGLRAFFRKHKRLLRPRAAGWAFAHELWSVLLLWVVATFCYPVYLVWLGCIDPFVLLFVLCIAFAVNGLLSLLSVLAVARVARRVEQPWSLVPAALATPFYREVLRWVRLWAFALELLRVDYEDPYLPRSAWVEAPRY